MTQRFTITDLQAVVNACAGTEEASELKSDVDFADLGLDSLAVYEIVSALQERLGIRIADDDIDSMTTPGHVVAYVNGRLADVAT